MKLQDYKPPFRLYGEHCIQGSGGDVVPYLSAGLVGEFIDILNAHFTPKEEHLIGSDKEMTGMCGKCLTSHHKSYIGKKCVASSECGGTVATMVYAEQPKSEPHQPNRKETDAIAAKYYESGRKLEVQFWDSKQWNSGFGKSSEEFNPSFDYSLPWRIKPAKRRVVVEIHESPIGKLICCVVADGNVALPKDYRFLGTIEGEVEA